MCSGGRSTEKTPGIDWLKLAVLVPALFVIGYLAGNSFNTTSSTALPAPAAKNTMWVPRSRSDIESITPTKVEDIAHIKLIDNHQNTFQLRQLLGSIFVVHFVPSQCDAACNQRITKLRSVSTETGINTVAVMIDATSGTFLTTSQVDGTDETITWLSGSSEAISSYISLFDRNPQRDAETELAREFYLFNRQGHLVQQYAGDNTPEKRLVRDITALSEIL